MLDSLAPRELPRAKSGRPKSQSGDWLDWLGQGDIQACASKGVLCVGGGGGSGTQKLMHQKCPKEICSSVILMFSHPTNLGDGGSPEAWGGGGGAHMPKQYSNSGMATSPFRGISPRNCTATCSPHNFPPPEMRHRL